MEIIIEKNCDFEQNAIALAVKDCFDIFYMSYTEYIDFKYICDGEKVKCIFIVAEE